jgi:hypothetical protein
MLSGSTFYELSHVLAAAGDLVAAERGMLAASRLDRKLRPDALLQKGVWSSQRGDVVNSRQAFAQSVKLQVNSQLTRRRAAGCALSLARAPETSKPSCSFETTSDLTRKHRGSAGRERACVDEPGRGEPATGPLSPRPGELPPRARERGERRTDDSLQHRQGRLPQPRGARTCPASAAPPSP